LPPAHTTHKADGNSLAWRYSSALLLLVIAGLLIACGGSANPEGPDTVTLTWDAVQDPNLGGYRIYYSISSEMYPQLPGGGVDVSINVTTYSVTGLISGTTYCFWATAYDSSNPPNESDFSNVVCKSIF